MKCRNGQMEALEMSAQKLTHKCGDYLKKKKNMREIFGSLPVFKVYDFKNVVLYNSPLYIIIYN